MGKNNVKVVIAIVCLLLAGALIAWQLGVFGGGSSSSSGTGQGDISYDENTTVEERSTGEVDPETGGQTLGGASEAFKKPTRR